jgi:hypothetical protein
MTWQLLQALSAKRVALLTTLPITNIFATPHIPPIG